jgi:hypothetical protein
MESWDQDFVDEDGPGHIIFKRDGLGGLHFGCVDVGLDWQYDQEMDRVDFTFEGIDDTNEVSGRGWAKIEGKQMVGRIVFHLGDESGFTAKKSK